MSTDLTKKPYCLNKEQIHWVQNTIHHMTLEEKTGQLFIHMAEKRDEASIRMLTEKYHIGGIRYLKASAADVLEMSRRYQLYSKIPVFITVNGETGGCDACQEGTAVATGAQCAAASADEAAYELGRISGVEATAVGCNWTFSPVADILFNWRNTVVNSRAFGSEADRVLALSRAYIRGVHESRMLACAKHFPGDGVEERDQHLLMGVNDLSWEEWENSFGRVYRGLIDDGLESVMVGHIAFPDYSKRFGGIRKDQDILPASVAPELVNGLLRTKLGFQGLVLTDASHMGGLLSSMPRRDQVPAAIAAGCDMFLFFHDIDEDFHYMLDGIKNGVISEARLQDALEHILGMKAKLGLHTCDFEKEFDEKKEKIAAMDYESHHQTAWKVADDTVTLVKDTQKLLPIHVKEKTRACLYYLESAPTSLSDGTDPAKQIVMEELRRVGFEVTLHESFYDLEVQESTPLNRFRAARMPGFAEFRETYDVVFVFVHMKGYAQENNVHVKYSVPHSNELPWWVRDVPTVCVSLNFTNHLYDLPMMKTFINAYAPTRECIRAAIEKAVGQSCFKGSADEQVWCGRWDTRL